MKETRLAFKIIKTLIKDSLHFPDRLIVDTVTIFARCGILLILYWYVFKINNGIINGTTFIFVAWSIFFYFSFSTLKLREISRQIMNDIRTGNVEVLFSKPISYILYRMWWQIGLRAYSFIIITTASVILLALIIGFPSTMTNGLFISTFIITFMFGLFLTLFIYLAVGLLAFWIEDINPVFWIIDKAVMVLGGSYLPIALFPPMMYKIALYSPFGASQFITHTVYSSWQNNWYTFLGIQLFWLALIGFVVYLMFEIAKKRVSVNGG